MNSRAIALSVIGFGLIALVTALPARAVEAKADFRPLVVAALDGHILPRHKVFAGAAADLERAATAFCAGDGPLADVQATYHGAMDGWMGVQHIAFGPIQSFNRRYRLEFWPDKRNTAPGQITALLAEQNADILKPQGFTFASVAVQGLPVIERLVFSDPPPAGYACKLLVAITSNVRTMATDLLAEWRDGGESWGQEVRDAAAGGSDLLGSSAEVAGMLLGGIGGQLQLIGEYKLRGPLKGNLPESPLSGRSLRNVQVNLEALNELYTLAFLPAVRDQDAKFSALLERAFAQTRATASVISVPLAVAVKDPAHRRTLEKLATETGALRQLAAEKAADRLGLALGFNALDGD